MTDLTLHGRSVATVFDLLGVKENDITYSLGWALSQSDRLCSELLRDVLSDVAPRVEPGAILAVRLQEFLSDGGFTDIEIDSVGAPVIIEAKRGWQLPTDEQLAQYASRVEGPPRGVIVAVSECSAAYANSRLPTTIGKIPVRYRSWREITDLVEETAREGSHAEKRLLRELVRYLKGLMTMQNQTSNLVYVVSLGSGATDWSGGLTPVRIVTERNCYFHQVGGSGWPKTPPNYLGFRYGGQLQAIRHVEQYQIFTDPHDHIPEIPSADWGPHFLYQLGPPVRPPKKVATGKMWPNGRVWAALDLLLTCDTIAEARDLTRIRMSDAGA